MTGHPRRVTKGGDDAGAILIIAILVVTVVALVSGFVLTQGNTSLRATVALREVAGSTYAADAAAQVALNAMRTGYSPGDPNGATPDGDWAFNNSFDGTGCFGRDTSGGAVNTLVLPNLYPPTGRQTQGTSAAVECLVEDGTGAAGAPVPVTNANKPGHAILTLGTAAGEPGISIKPQSSTVEQFRVRGGVWSNSNIVAEIGSLQTPTSIRAHTGCSPMASMQAPFVDCASATVPDPGIAEPAKYAHDASSGAPLLQTVPSSCGAVVTFEPGLYDDANALETLTDNNACRDSTFHFRPGTYYFDFHNNSADPMSSGAISSGDDEWTVGVGDLVAGTPVGDIAAPVFPGSCVSPIDDVNSNGVQFIFGGDSRLKINDGANVEICGSYHPDRPPIAVYALKSGTATRTVLSEAASGDDGDPLAPSSVSVTPSGTFTGSATPEAMAGPGNGNLSWARTTTGNPATATVTLDGFAPPAAIPKGSVLKSASLLVTHSEKSASSISFKPTGSTASQTANLMVRDALTTDTVDLAALPGWPAVQKAFHDRGFSGARVEFTGNPRAGETTTLDGVRLQLAYYVPQLRGQDNAGFGASNCLATLNSCAVISTPTNFKTQFYVQGTTYTPISRLNLNLNQATAQVLRFGVIARSFEARTTGGYEYDGPVVELPDNSPGWGFGGTLVQLRVYLCPGASTCNASGQPALKVRAQMWDADGYPDPPEREVSVLSWSQQR